jgi:hypothetical protein
VARSGGRVRVSKGAKQRAKLRELRPVRYVKWFVKAGKYTPHQGPRECARRVQQWATLYGSLF